MPGAVPRPLSEISPSEKRRNSPSWHQRPLPQKASLNTDSSPFQSSPSESLASPRMFWQNRNENNYFGGAGSPSPHRRASVERLQKASRVKNSNILALEQKQEYDPTRLPHIERPLAKVQANTLGSGSFGLRSPTNDSSVFDLSINESKSSVLSMSLPKSPDAADAPRKGSRDQGSPTKSSLSPSKFKSSYDHESGIWSADESFTERQLPNGHALHRHTKSVTFDAAPPQVNEYETATPDISSIASDSREGSYDESYEDDEDDSPYNPAHMMGPDDSFDASLEDTDKTPVVGPDEWRRESSTLQDRENEYEQSPMPEATPSLATSGRPTHTRTDSTNSNGEHRPLPPLPGASLTRSQSNSSARASPGLSATAERMLGNQRSLPSPPPASSSKTDIQNIGNGKMSLEERLKLMMLSGDGNGKTAAEQQRERRLRRGLGRERLGSPGSEMDASALEAHEEDDTVCDISALDDYQLPPRISRESIMRRVNDAKDDNDYSFSSPPGSSPQRSPTRSPERYVPMDPDVPIPSTEDTILEDIPEDEDSVIITRSTDDEKDEVFDLYQHSDAETDDMDFDQHVEPSDGSHYSGDESPRERSLTGEGTDGVETPRAQSPVQAPIVEESQELPELKDERVEETSLSKDLESFMVREPEEPVEPVRELEIKRASVTAAPEYLRRPCTPEQSRSLSKPEYDGSGWGVSEDEEEPGTPESVIHHPVSSDSEEDEEEEPKEEPIVVPEQLATIKSSGSKLKTRLSGTPADLAAMREARRQVSYEVPIVPPIPEKHRNRLSRDCGAEPEVTGDDFLERHPSFKNRSLTLDLDLGLSLDQDFERVIESQKRGYLMRQNTKLVAASDKDADDSWKVRSAGSSPVKADRPQSWTVEPWNPATRQKSTRKRGMTGPVPPLPGQESNAVALQQVVEEDISAELATAESGERGRLFVKVVGVKDLDLPIPKSKQAA
jgi:hypothetical protein